MVVTDGLLTSAEGEASPAPSGRFCASVTSRGPTAPPFCEDAEARAMGAEPAASPRPKITRRSSSTLSSSSASSTSCSSASDGEEEDAAAAGGGDAAASSSVPAGQVGAPALRGVSEDTDPDSVRLAEASKEASHMGWLLKRNTGRWQPVRLAELSRGTALQGLFWRRRLFSLGTQRLAYKGVGAEENQVGEENQHEGFAVEHIDEVAVQGRQLSIHFAAPQRIGTKQREQSMLCVVAKNEAEAEEWGKSVRSAVAKLRPGLPTDWDIGAMLMKKSGDVRLVAKIPLPEGAVSTFQTLMDHTFLAKRTQDRRGGDLPLRLQVAEVFGVQNIAAWTEYIKARDRMSGKTAMAEDGGDLAWPHRPNETKRGLGGVGDVLDPEVRTTTLHSAKLRSLLGESSDEGGNEHWLFHGSTATAVRNIADTEFRVNLAGTHRGTLYGPGLYLAECCSKADEYAEAGEDGLYGMLLCRTLLGRVLLNRERKPDICDMLKQYRAGGYDSVCGDRWNVSGTYREFVVYGQNQVYPAYIISYRRLGLEDILEDIKQADNRTDPSVVSNTLLYSARIADRHPNPAIRSSIPYAMSHYVTKAWSAVVECCGDQCKSVRRDAVLALGMSGRPTDEHIGALLDRLQDEEQVVRVAAVRALDSLTDGDRAGIVTRLVALFEDPGETVRQAAVRTVEHYAFASDAAREALLEHAEDPNVRLDIVSCFGRLGPRAAVAVPLLARALADPAGDVRYAAAQSLLALGLRSTSVAPELVRAFEDERADVREVAIEAIIEMGNMIESPPAETFMKCFEDSAFGVRRAAAKAVGKLGKHAAPAVSGLVVLIRDANAEVRVAALRALAAVGTAAVSAIPFVELCLADEVPDVVVAAQAALEMAKPLREKQEKRDKKDKKDRKDGGHKSQKKGKKDEKEAASSSSKKSKKKEKKDRRESLDASESKHSKNKSKSRDKKDKHDEEPSKESSKSKEGKTGSSREGSPEARGSSPKPKTLGIAWMLPTACRPASACRAKCCFSSSGGGLEDFEATPLLGTQSAFGDPSLHDEGLGLSGGRRAGSGLAGAGGAGGAASLDDRVGLVPPPRSTRSGGLLKVAEGRSLT